MTKKKKLVLFDFDRTITTKDTFPLFFRFITGPLKFYAGFVLHSPLFLLHKFKMYDAAKLKKNILSHFLKSKTQQELLNMGTEFIKHLQKEGIIKGEFLEKINQYKNEGFEIAIVSASPDLWIKPFADNLGIHSLSTELEYVENIFTGGFRSENCNYKEKRNRIEKHFVLEDFEEIVVFGDSRGDEHMMEIATTQIWVK